ncbi:MAG: AI-2E family transporter [Devosia sp.]
MTKLVRSLPIALAKRSTEASWLDGILDRAWRAGIAIMAAIAIVLFLQLGRPIFAPVLTAILIGLVFGPIADMLEARGVKPALSAAVVVLAFLGIILASILLFSGPLSEWARRIPDIWVKLRSAIEGVSGPLESLSSLQKDLREALGTDTAINVAVQDGGPAQDVALMAPALLGEVLVFLGALYFFLASRHRLRVAVLSWCYTRKVRWRTAHVFRDMENQISQYLLAIGSINLGVGLLTTLALWAIGVPTPLVWGTLAGLANFVPYLGQLLMFGTLLVVGVGTQQGAVMIFLPLIAYAIINFAADQIIFPHLVGRALTLNPFVIFVSIITWIWIWGPLGSLVAVPSLLLLQSIALHLFPHPAAEPLPALAARRRVLANAPTK